MTARSRQTNKTLNKQCFGINTHIRTHTDTHTHTHAHKHTRIFPLSRANKDPPCAYTESKIEWKHCLSIGQFPYENKRVLRAESNPAFFYGQMRPLIDPAGKGGSGQKTRLFLHIFPPFNDRSILSLSIYLFEKYIYLSWQKQKMARQLG